MVLLHPVTEQKRLDEVEEAQRNAHRITGFHAQGRIKAVEELDGVDEHRLEDKAQHTEPGSSLDVERIGDLSLVGLVAWVVLRRGVDGGGPDVEAKTPQLGDLVVEERVRD